LALKTHSNFGCAASLATLDKLVDRFTLPSGAPPIGDTSLTHVMKLAAHSTKPSTPTTMVQYFIMMKKHKRERIVCSCSNRMRELWTLLIISFRQITENENIVFAEILHPKNVCNILFATRRIVGYDHEKKTFTAPSLATHLGISLKLTCNELTTLILKQSRSFQRKTSEDAKL
jgi:hypothetical protein